MIVICVENPRDLDELPAVYKEAVLRLLSPELPLEIVVDRIDDEDYWHRRCDLTFDLSKVLALYQLLPHRSTVIQPTTFDGTLPDKQTRLFNSNFIIRLL